jgi:LPXTG-motif cell wall-anchored protein
MSDAVPQTGSYMAAAYIVAAAILLGYAIVLARRARRS